MENPEKPRLLTDEERRKMQETGINPAKFEGDEWTTEPTEAALTPLQYMIRRAGAGIPPEVRRRFGGRVTTDI
jgi:hypothetical protein